MAVAEDTVLEHVRRESDQDNLRIDRLTMPFDYLARTFLSMTTSLVFRARPQTKRKVTHSHVPAPKT